MKNIIYLLSIFFIFLSKSPAEDLQSVDSTDYTLKPRYGLYFNYNYNLNVSSFTDLPGINVCCPNYDDGYGFGFSMGALFEYPLDQTMRIAARLGFDSYAGKFNSVEIKNVIIDGKSQAAEIEFLLDSKYSSIGVEPTFLYSFFHNFWANFSLRFALATNSDHYQKEEIIKPDNRGTFNDGLRKHNLSYGDIPALSSFELGFRIGASYETKLNKDSSLILAPEISYGYNLTPVVSGLNWNVHVFRAGLSVKYRESQPPPPPPPPPLPPPFPKPTLPEAPPALAASVQVFRVDSTGKLEKNFNVQIEDFISLNMRPLLNYVFFEQNSSTIPDRYIKIKYSDTKNFGIKSLQNLGALETYYQVLNIIGLRLRNNPDAKIEIVGCNSNTDDEKGNTDLSRDRAVAVRDYLRDVWEIDGTRMPIKARNLPDKPSKSDDSVSLEENRRVEILTNDFRINEPVTTTDTMRVVDDYNLRFLNTWKSDIEIDNWQLVAEYDNKTIFEKNGMGAPDSTIAWKLSQNGNRPKSAGSIFYFLKVQDKLGQTAISSKNRLPVEQLTIDRKRLESISDKEFEYYSLILFDFGKSELRKEHKSVADLIKNRIMADSKIYIKGYTDSIGEEETNKKLSDKRASSVAKRLKIPSENVQGIGESSLLYPNDTPEGRFYCRTVQIIIETPVKD